MQFSRCSAAIPPSVKRSLLSFCNVLLVSHLQYLLLFADQLHETHDDSYNLVIPIY